MSAMPQGGEIPIAPTSNPDDLLQQIRALLDQYLAMGPDTPVAGQAQQLADAIDQTGGGAPSLGDMETPPEGGLGDETEPVVPPENQGAAAEEPPPNTEAKTYGQANMSALDRLKKRNKDQGR